jgi:hypothetical protein
VPNVQKIVVMGQSNISNLATSERGKVEKLLKPHNIYWLCAKKTYGLNMAISLRLVIES